MLGVLGSRSNATINFRQRVNMYARTMNILCLVVFIVLLVAGAKVSAADNSDWKGWYAGAFGGYVSGELDSDNPAHRESTGDYDDDSPMAGVAVGYNRQFDNGWVGGLEVMLPLYMQKGRAVDKKYFPDSVFYEAHFRYGILIAVKYGHDYGQVLPYAFGAIGLTSVNGKTLNVDLNENYSEGFEQSAAATHFIWQLGAGADYQASETIFVGARVAAFVGAKADHTMPWNEPGPNKFGYKSLLLQMNVGYKL